VRTTKRSQSRSGAVLEIVSAAQKGQDDVTVRVEESVTHYQKLSLGVAVLASLSWSVGVLVVCALVYLVYSISSGRGEDSSGSPKPDCCRPRAPTDHMRMDLVTHVKSASGVPSVFASDGCGPYVEIRCVTGDPKTKHGGLQERYLATQRTRSQAEGNVVEPVWNETLTLANVACDPAHFINIILWDSSADSKNSPIGYHSRKITEFLSGLKYDPEHDSTQPQKLIDYTASGFISLSSDAEEVLPLVVNLSIGYLEVHKFEVSIASAHHLPPNNEGSLDSFVEIRIVNGHPQDLEYHTTPHHETIWHGRTKSVLDSTNPEFHDKLTFIIPANPAHYMIVCVMEGAADAGISMKHTTTSTTLGNTLIGMAVVSMKHIMTSPITRESFSKVFGKTP